MTVLSGCGKIKIVFENNLKDEPSKVTEKEITRDEGTTENEVLDTAIVVADDTEEKNDTSFNIVANLGRGINVGNALDCYDEWNSSAVVTETYWGNPEIKKEYIEKLVDSGFSTIRIPVTWGPHVQNGVIDASFMTRVHEIVDYAYNKGAYVIIDIHHDKQFSPSYDNYEASKEYLENIWVQISDEFKDYDERLIFEGINEPRCYGTGEEWSDGTDESAEVVNKLMADFVSAVRNSGGNNNTRLLLVTGYCNRSGAAALNRIILPQDENIAVSIHSYDPYEFTSSGGYRDFDNNYKGQLDNMVETLKSFMSNNNVPIVITEWGAYESVGKNGRVQYINYATEAFDGAGIPCIWWDNGQSYGSGAYGLFDRNTCDAIDQEAVEALLKEN